jgi:hypothetical protein
MFPVALAWTLGTVIGGLLHERWLIVAVLLSIAFLAAAVISKGHIYCLLGALLLLLRRMVCKNSANLP